MTSKDLERHWLSLRHWLLSCVLPSSLVLIGVLALLRMISDRPSVLNHSSVIVGFFTLYFVLVRGGHLIMIRSLHRELQETFGSAYEARLAAISPVRFQRLNLGFTLAQIKRDLTAAKIQRRQDSWK